MMRRGLVLLVGMALHGVAASRAEEPTAISGVTEPIRSVVLKPHGKRTPPWSGRIARVLVKEGQQVVAGQPVVEMEKRSEEIELRLRELLARDEDELKTVRERERLQRSLWLLNKGVADENRSVSREEVTRRELEYRITMGDRQRLESGLKRAQIELESARVELENRTVRSPINGTVVKIHLREGEACEANDPLAQIVDTSRASFVCNVEEKIGRALQVGQPVQLKIQAGATQEVTTGTIVFVSPVVELASFLLSVKAEFNNRDGLIRPGVPGVMLTGPSGR